MLALGDTSQLPSSRGGFANRGKEDQKQHGPMWLEVRKLRVAVGAKGTLVEKEIDCCTVQSSGTDATKTG